MTLPHLPAIRRGKPYESLDSVEVLNHRTGEPMARVSQVNAGIIRKDLGRIGEARAALKKFTVEPKPASISSMASCRSVTKATCRARRITSRRSPPPAACRT